jgi:hypothetical protein
MVTPTRGSPIDGLAASSNTGRASRTALNNSTTSFAQQLAQSLESYLGQSSAGAHLEIDVLPQQGGNSSTRQFIVTVKDSGVPVAPGPASVRTPTAEVSEPESESFGGMMFSGSPASSAVEEPAAEPPPANEIEAYWASQPKEVRILRTIDDYEERGVMGQKLAAQGFVIDYATMILRWDPYMANRGRLEEGYTWIPSMMQNPIPLAPGLGFPGLPSYDPAHPPPGSVIVSTDFAIGLEHTSPGARPPHRGDAIRT